MKNHNREIVKIKVLKEVGRSRKQGLTLPEAASKLGVQLNMISGRFTDLLKAGLIYRTGEKRDNPGTGCPCNVYKVVGRK